MSTHEKKQLDKNFNKFTKTHFENPGKCKSINQIRFYIQELSNKISEFKSNFNYVPNSAYSLLTQYNSAHNCMVMTNFKEIYKPVKW